MYKILLMVIYGFSTALWAQNGEIQEPIEGKAFQVPAEEERIIEEMPIEDESAPIGKERDRGMPYPKKYQKKPEPVENIQNKKKLEKAIREEQEAQRTLRQKKRELDRSRIEQNTPRENYPYQDIQKQQRRDFETQRSERDYQDAKTKAYWSNVKKRHYQKQLERDKR